MRRVGVVLYLAAIALTIVVGITAGVSAGVLVLGVVVVIRFLDHVWFTTWGPNATPNRLYQRRLWENNRRARRERRAHRREYRDRLAGRTP